MSGFRFPHSLLAAAAALALWFSPLAAHPQTSAGFQIAGRVVNSATGDPVPLATVTALSETSNSAVATAVTDADGRFSIAGLPAGKYPLTASRRGFRTAYYDEHEESFNTAIVTGPDQDTTHLLFKLAPGAVIYGTVTGDGGDPVQEATVLLFRRAPAAPSHRPAGMQSVATDDIGAYEFDNLPAGEYFIAVQAHPWYAQHGLAPPQSSAENPLDAAYPITFFDSTTDEAAATSLQVDAGSRTEADISLHSVPALHLTLPRPRQNDNGPGIQVQQSVFGSRISVPSNIESVGRGPWDVSGLAPGHYEVITNDPPRTTDLDAAASMDIDPASGTPSQPVDGTVRMADGSPPGDLDLMLASKASVNAGMPTLVRNGQFHFPPVPPGIWTLSAGISRTPVYIASVAIAGATIPANHIAVGDRPLTLAVTLSRSQTRIAGFARDNGKPVSGAMIVLVPRDPAAWPSLVRRDQSDSDGSFSLSNVAPGRYTVIAIDGWNLDWQDRSVIGRYLRAGQDVTIGIQTGGVVQLPQPVQAVSP